MAAGKFAAGLCLLALGLTQSLSASAATPLNEIRYGTDTRITVGSPTVTLATSQIARDLLAGPVTTLNLGTISPGVVVVAYHRLSNGNHLFVVDSTTVLGGLTFGPRDVIQYDGTTYNNYFAGASHSVPDGAGISGIALVNNTTLLLSFDSTVLLGAITFKPTDIAQWSGSAYSLCLDSAAQGVAAGALIQDFHYLDSTHLLLSFASSGTVGGVTYDRSDILEYTPGSPGTWEVSYQGSAHSSGWRGADLTAFWAWAATPLVVTNPATNIVQTGATLNGSVDDNGTTTAVSFRYGMTTAYGQTATANSVTASSGPTPVTAAITRLTCNTTYHF